MENEFAFELIERLRRLESLLIGARPVLIDNLKAKIDALAIHLKAKYSSWLPFKGKYIEALRTFLIGEIDHVKALWDSAHTSGDVHAFINAVIDYAKGNLKLGWPLSMFAGAFLEGVRQWLHANTDVLKDQVGALPPK